MRPLGDTLGIYVITYNRAAALERTLRALEESPFRECKITVLDNHSDDRTPEVCAAFAARLPDLNTVRHRVNVGLSANYLRAVELSTHAYTWIIGDDDEFDFGAASEVIERIRIGDVDLIVAGAVNQPEWALGKLTSAQALFARGFPYFYITGWITGVIFRTSSFDDEAVHLGYKNSDNVFPHFPFFIKCLARDASVYVASRWLASSRGTGEYGRLGSVMIAGYMHSFRHVADENTRRAALKHGPLGQGQDFSYLRAAVYFFRIFGIHNLVQRKTILDAWLKCFSVAPWDIRLTLLPSGLHLVCPVPLARIGWQLLHALRPNRHAPDVRATHLDEART